MNTQDYIHAAKRLNDLAHDLKWGNPLNHKACLAKIGIAEAIANSAFAICNSLATPTKEITEAQSISNAAFELARVYIHSRFNRIHGRSTNYDIVKELKG